MKFVLMFAGITLAGTLLSALGECAEPPCSPPKGYVEYRAIVTVPTDASQQCIDEAHHFTHMSRFSFQDGKILYGDVEEQTSKDRCKYAAWSDPASVGIIFAFDRNWYRGTGLVFDGDSGCRYPMRFVRD